MICDFQFAPDGVDNFSNIWSSFKYSKEINSEPPTHQGTYLTVIY